MSELAVGMSYPPPAHHAACAVTTLPPNAATSDALSVNRSKRPRRARLVAASLLLLALCSACSCSGGAPPELDPADCDAVDLVRSVDDAHSLDLGQVLLIRQAACQAWDARFPNPASPQHSHHGTDVTCSDESRTVASRATVRFAKWLFGPRDGSDPRAVQPSYEGALRIVAEVLVESDEVESDEIVGLRGASRGQVEQWLRDNPGFMIDVFAGSDDLNDWSEETSRWNRWVVAARSSSCPDTFEQ